MQEYMDHLPVFDRRNKLREIALVKKFRKTTKPLILVNFNGHTSPMRDWTVIVAELCKLGDQCEILNTNEMNATRIYDLLGVMDRAAGLITLDTMTLHLAPACKIPYIAYVRDDCQAGSIPKGNCVRKVGYSRVREDLDAVMEIVRGWIN